MTAFLAVPVFRCPTLLGQLAGRQAMHPCPYGLFPGGQMPQGSPPLPQNRPIRRIRSGAYMCFFEENGHRVPLTIADIYATLESPPNPRQRDAIELLDGPVRIIAGPGSGKTYALVVRALNLICCRGIPPGRVVVVTFTERAAR